MTPAQSTKLMRLGPFNLAQAAKIGVPQRTISDLVKKGLVQRVGRGIYLHPKANISAVEIGFQIACAKFGPQSAIGGMSALFHYNLIEQVPGQTWLIVPPEKRTRERIYRLIRTKSNLSVGIISKNGYKIASIERALVEGLKLATKIGERTALKAIRTALTQRMTTEAKLGKMAKELGHFSIFVKHFEAIVI
jgi:predicted transcriptional regulator of viral defense system